MHPIRLAGATRTMFQAQVISAPPEEMRTARRRLLDVQAYIRQASAIATPAQVRDLSTDGCRIASEARLETCTTIWLRIDGVGARQARIVWSRDGSYGCEFLSPIQAAVVEELHVARARQARSALTPAAGAFGSRS